MFTQEFGRVSKDRAGCIKYGTGYSLYDMIHLRVEMVQKANRASLLDEYWIIWCPETQIGRAHV